MNSKFFIRVAALLLLVISCDKEEQQDTAPQYSLFLSSSEGGTVSDVSGLYREGDKVNIKALANRGYVFIGWEGIDDPSESLEITMNQSWTLKANFQLDVKVLNNNVTHIVEELVDNTGYILAIENGKNTCYLLDRNGQKLRTWTFDLPLGQDAELAPDGSLYGLFQVPNPNTDLTFGGKSGLIRKINTSNQVVWEFEISSENEITHHDLELMPNGNLMVLVWHRIRKEEAALLGYISDHDLFVEKLVEINPELNRIVWEWNSWDHIVQNKVEDHPTFGDPKTQRNKIDIMYNYQSDYHRFIAIGDIMHANGIAYLPDNDLLAVSINFYNEVWFIDHSTSAQEAKTSAGGNFNLGGDLVYRFGNPSAMGLSDPKVFDFNHHPTFTYNNGVFNLLIFNNNAAEERSKAMEFELPTFSGSSTEIGPSPKIVFEYANDDMYFEIVGGAVRLPNGNTLICEGDFGYWEVNESGQLLWKYDGQGASFWRGLYYSKESAAIKSLGL
jgi:hypothetical protein